MGAIGLLVLGCNINSPQAKFRLAERLLEDRKYEAAIVEFNAIVDRSPNSEMGLAAQLKIAEIRHIYLGQAKEAQKAYEAVLKRTTDPAQQQRIEKTLADIHFTSFENYDESIKAYSKLMQELAGKPESEEMMFRLGRSFFMKGQFSDSIDILQYQLKNFPEGGLRWKAELEIGHALSASGRCRETTDRFSQLVQRAPKEIVPLAKFAMATCFEELDDLDRAYELLDEIRSSHPSAEVVDLKMQKIKRRKILRKR
jgi:TolA-binding protein